MKTLVSIDSRMRQIKDLLPITYTWEKILKIGLDQSLSMAKVEMGNENKKNGCARIAGRS
jgi:hypothetical protein